MGFLDVVKTVAPFVPVVGPAISAVTGLIGASKTNSAQDARQQDAEAFNAEQAQLNRDFQAGQAKQQMDYQERLSNSAYQRAMGDMRTAGLNPLLAYSQGGASTPIGASASGSQASAPTPAPVINKTAAAMDAASKTMANAQQFSQIENINANTKKTQADEELTRVRTQVEASDIKDKLDYKPGTGTTYSADVKRRQANLLGQMENTEVEKAQLTTQQRQLVMEEIKNAVEQNRAIVANTRSTTANAVLAELAQGEGRARHDFWTGPYGGSKAVGLKHYSEMGHSALGAALAIGGGLGTGLRQFSNPGRRSDWD